VREAGFYGFPETHIASVGYRSVNIPRTQAKSQQVDLFSKKLYCSRPEAQGDHKCIVKGESMTK